MLTYSAPHCEKNVTEITVTERHLHRILLYMKRLLPLLSLIALAGCMSAEAQIKQEISDANYCETAADCVDVGGKCPFDCYIFVNASEADRIGDLVGSYNSTCEYSCIAIDGVDCVDNKCQAIVPGPPMEGETQADPEGNVGASCTSHEECVTPMSYLIQSNCPYSSRCVEGSCSVVCPQWQDSSAGYDVSCDADSDCNCADRPNAESCKCIDNQCVAVMK
jgi:hypothetical protein